MKRKFNLDDLVRKVAHDYTNGRMGQIRKLNRKNKKAQILWFKTESGATIKSKTWVKWSYLKFVTWREY